jgi:hypothetical protein
VVGDVGLGIGSGVDTGAGKLGLVSVEFDGGLGVDAGAGVLEFVLGSDWVTKIVVVMASVRKMNMCIIRQFMYTLHTILQQYFDKNV